MKKGDQVKVWDGSWAVRVDKYEEYTSIGLCKDIFEIVKVKHHNFIKSVSGEQVHDIIIRNTNNNKTYLHSEAFVNLTEPKVKEIKISDLENKYGCKVKIIK